jgi:hypothetical protein
VCVSSQLKQADVSHGIGGTPAICDGALHRRRNGGGLDATAYAHGQAHVTSTLPASNHGWGIPLPPVLAAQGQDVTLVPDRR